MKNKLRDWKIYCFDVNNDCVSEEDFSGSRTDALKKSYLLVFQKHVLTVKLCAVFDGKVSEKFFWEFFNALDYHDKL